MTGPTRDPIDDRMRAALRNLPLPEAPGTLRHILATLPDRAAAAGERSSRGRGSPGLAIAAVVVVAIIGTAGLLGLTRAPAAPGATAGSSATAESPSAVTVLDAAQLDAAIAAQRAGDLSPQWVVTSVSIDGTRIPEPAQRTCVPDGVCTIVGVLRGFSDEVGAVAGSPGGDSVPVPARPEDLAGPIALKLAGTAPIELLGHVDLASGSGIVGVPALLAATDSAPPQHLRAVDGWLVGADGSPSCGPAMDPVLPAPFACPPMRALLTSEPVKPIVPSAGGGSIDMPPDAVQVQQGAYRAFAQDPASDGTNDEPRRAVYLVRLVAIEAPGCQGCRGWLVVGRLDAEPAAAPTATPAPAVTLRSAAELKALLVADRASWIGRPVFIDGEIDPGSASSCPSNAYACRLGTLTGTDERVVASPYTASLLPPDANDATHGRLALVVRATGLEYLGWLASYGDGVYETTVADLMDLASRPRGPMVTTVRGWLVAGLPTPCPAPAQGLPEDTPFNPCPPAWLTRDEVQPTVVGSGSISYQEPAVGVRVQYSAYDAFAPEPLRVAASGSGAPTSGGSWVVTPRFGTYVVRLVTDTRMGDADTGAKGWQVVGRLEPAPEVAVTPGVEAGPLPTASPSPTPGATATPAATPAVAPSASPFGTVRVAGAPMTVRLIGDPAVFTGWRSATQAELTRASDRWEIRDIGLLANGDGALLLIWLGGQCDTGATLAIAPSSVVLTEDPRQACDAVGIVKGIVLTPSSPLDPSTVDATFVQAIPTP